ncbi:hypothetical protein MRB53_004165 [Persea americana]|uniref:Uncharacterized protein n=1 Tax=Persea americana TaxID=3435 RepID=A0ACC2MZE1_PERAE|nr:hypothetical protein MRB53_004165 [Persea americana]
MHLWPSLRIRESFKLNYLVKLEWNLQRMKAEKQSQDSRNKLLENQGDSEVIGKSTSIAHGISDFCSAFLMIASCCYCCFCCGACNDQEEN